MVWLKLWDGVGVRKKIFKNANKSWVGSISFFLGGWLLAVIVLAVFVAAGVFQDNFREPVVPANLDCIHLNPGRSDISLRHGQYFGSTGGSDSWIVVF